jgi:hypothetical protein
MKSGIEQSSGAQLANHVMRSSFTDRQASAARLLSRCAALC